MLDKICAPDFLLTFEQRVGNFIDLCNSTITQAWTTVCDTWKGKNATASCGAIKEKFKGLLAQGCLPAGMMLQHDAGNKSEGAVTSSSS